MVSAELFRNFLTIYREGSVSSAARYPAANHSSIPEGKKLSSTLHIGALPIGIEELFGGPGTSSFELTTD